MGLSAKGTQWQRLQSTPPTNRLSPPALRHVPDWAWALGALFHPASIFICLGAAKALRWWWAVLLAATSCAVWFLFTRETIAGQGENPAIIMGGLFYHACVGMLQYGIGQRRDLWTPGGRWVWRLGAYLLIGLLALTALSAAFRLVAHVE